MKYLIFLSNPALPTITFIGRLTPVKRIDLLIDAVNGINTHSAIINLLIMGGGTEMEELKKMGEDGVNNRWIHFTGACFDEEMIGKYLSKADLCVSPGNVGLIAIHSFSFGTPMSTHSNMSNQMPEAEALQEGYNGFFFKENDVEDLKNKINEWFQMNLDRDLVKNRCMELLVNTTIL